MFPSGNGSPVEIVTWSENAIAGGDKAEDASLSLRPGMPLVPVIAMPVDANPHARWSGMLKILKKALKRLAFFLFLPRRKSHVPRTPFA